MRVTTSLNGNRQPLQPARHDCFDDSPIGFMTVTRQNTQASIERFSLRTFGMALLYSDDYVYDYDHRK